VLVFLHLETLGACCPLCSQRATRVHKQHARAVLVERYEASVHTGVLIASSM
jgi:hypothetical protein